MSHVYFVNGGSEAMEAARKPTEAMVADATALGKRTGLIASFAPTLPSMPCESPASVEVVSRLADGAREALSRGDTAEQDARVTDAAVWLAQQGCDVIVLVQFSMVRAQTTLRQTLSLPVLTTPASAVRALRQRLGA